MLRSISASDTYLYAGTQGGGIYKLPLSDVLAVDETEGKVTPAGFGLGQNYPNPFNPSTTIRFDVPVRSFVSLKIDDAMGREVAAIVSENLPAGKCSRVWNASGMPSGFYFYRLQTGAYVETKRLVIVK